MSRAEYFGKKFSFHLSSRTKNNAENFSGEQKFELIKRFAHNTIKLGSF